MCNAYINNSFILGMGVGLLSMTTTQGWKRFVPYEVAPIIGAMGIVACMASYRLYSAANLHDVRFTRFGGVNNWQERLEQFEGQHQMDKEKA